VRRKLGEISVAETVSQPAGEPTRVDQGLQRETVGGLVGRARRVHMQLIESGGQAFTHPDVVHLRPEQPLDTGQLVDELRQRPSMIHRWGLESVGLQSRPQRRYGVVRVGLHGVG
jgi:hypothetical protein